MTRDQRHDGLSQYINQSVRISGEIQLSNLIGVPLEKFATSHKIRKIAMEGEDSDKMCSSIKKKRIRLGKDDYLTSIGPYRNNKSYNSLNKNILTLGNKISGLNVSLRDKKETYLDLKPKHNRVLSKLGPGIYPLSQNPQANTFQVISNSLSQSKFLFAHIYLTTKSKDFVLL